LISYPLYLWHWPLLSFAQIVHGGAPSALVRSGLLAISVALAAATYYLIERPIRFGVHRRGTVAALATAMSALCAAGIYVFTSGGLIDRAVNRSDAASLVDYYERMRKTGLATAYRRECDFMDWKTEQTRQTIDASCTTPGKSHTVLLWGDSFAQALSLGLRQSLPAESALAQVATSACRAQVADFDRRPDQRCEVANRYAIAAIERLRPDLVVIAQSSAHNSTDWPALTDRVLALGARHVVVVGPFPRWQPGLPRIYGERHLADHADYVGTEFASGDRVIDQAARNSVAGRAEVTYLSLLDHLCNDGACLARVPDEDPLDLMVLDAGHLTPKGSAYLGRLIWKPMLTRLLR
jgi:hypothetical protein